MTIRSQKVKDLDPVAPTYEENASLAFGTEKIVDNGSTGSVYKSYRVLKKGDAVIKEEPLHNSTYKGKPAVIQRNTTHKPVETQPETTAETQPETTVPEIQGPGATMPSTQEPDQPQA